MKCPNCKSVDLIPVMTRQGAEVDFCDRCEGIWLDKNEIYLFTSAPAYLKSKIDEAMGSKKESPRLSPIFGRPMLWLPILDGEIHFDYCPESEGIWLDKEEINLLPAVKARIQIDKGMFKDEPVPAAGVPVLPSLALRSAVVLAGMYALLSLFLIILVESDKITASTALTFGIIFAVLQFIFAPFLMDLSLRWFYKMRWVKPEELPVHLKNFIQKVCAEKKINFPRMGIISDGAPNAFTYGHHPQNARVVVTQGLLDLLEPQEAEAVIAHELGHVVHWDILVMTLAQLVPLIFYYVYKTLIRVKSKGKDKSAPYRILIAVGAYLLYLLTEFIVLWFSRLREYFADRFSGQVTGNPDALASALVKIGYGLAGENSMRSKQAQQERSDTLNAVGPIGLFNYKAANMLAISGYAGPNKMGGVIDKEKLKDASKWDIWNPWAAYYELQSTHPLVAKRLKHLTLQSRSLGRAPFFDFNAKKPECYWDDFLFDLLIKLLPLAAFIGGLALFAVKKDISLLWFGVFLFGCAYLVNTIFSYPDSEFMPMNIKSLLNKIKVSAIRPIPCKIKGRIIGRGVPGLIFSEDFVLQDETGIIFLDYRQPLGLIEFFFGLLRASNYIGQDVEITGWYRRSPVPYIEIKKIKMGQRESGCFVYNFKMLVAAGLIALGFFMGMSLLFR